jgi:hypothetical protein
MLVCLNNDETALETQIGTDHRHNNKFIMVKVVVGNQSVFLLRGAIMSTLDFLK